MYPDKFEFSRFLTILAFVDDKRCNTIYSASRCNAPPKNRIPMDKRTHDVMFFLPYWDIENPTSDDQTGFILSEVCELTECWAIGGETYSSKEYHDSKQQPEEFIKEVIRKRHPRWVIGIENTATILLSLRRQKKILVNPTVTLNDLNWVTQETIRDTYAFFSADHEEDYEMYSRVYQNAAFYPLQKTLTVGELSPIITEIISE